MQSLKHKLISLFAIAVLCRAETSGQLVLQDGTPVRLRLARNLSSATAQTGETVDFEVLEDVSVDGAILIEKGAVALGNVTNSEPKRRMGRTGKLDVSLDHVRLVSGDNAALRAIQQKAGASNAGKVTTAVVVTSLVFWPAAPLFLLAHGKDVTIPKGTEITAYVNGDMKLDPVTLRAHSAGRKDLRPASYDGAASAATNVHTAPAANGITLRFTSNPDKAEVDVDGVYWGSTPTQDLTRIAAGTHTIVVKRSGYVTWERKIELALGDDRTVAAELEVDRSKPQIKGLD